MPAGSVSSSSALQMFRYAMQPLVMVAFPAGLSARKANISFDSGMSRIRQLYFCRRKSHWRNKRRTLSLLPCIDYSLNPFRTSGSGMQQLLAPASSLLFFSSSFFQTLAPNIQSLTLNTRNFLVSEPLLLQLFCRIK